MKAALRSNLGRVARRASSPFRSFFNHHFAMVKQEMTTSRDQLLVGTAEVQRTAARVADSADKVEESTTFLASRLGRLLERQEAVEAAVGALDERTRASLGALTTVAADDALWCAFVARALHDVPVGARVLVADDAGSVAATLVALGYTVAGTAAGGTADAVVGRHAATVLAAASTEPPTALVVVASADESLGDDFTTVATVRHAGGALVAARRAGEATARTARSAKAQPRLR